MHRKIPLPHVGLRTIKTTAAIILSLILVHIYGTTDSKYIFAMLGAMAAMEPTFKESLEACLTQFIGLICGAIAGILLLMLPIPTLLQCGIGILLIITLYNTLHIRFSPTLPCMMVVIICTTPDVQPIPMAVGRFWDTAIGLALGMLINSLVFPYDNSRRIRTILEELDRDTITFLEEFYDGDAVLPDPEIANRKIDDLEHQLRIFSNQKLWLRLRRQNDQLAQFRLCQTKALELVAEMKVLHNMARPARLDEENRRKLTAAGADIRDKRRPGRYTERDIVANYHVSQILSIRKDLLKELNKS